MNIAVVGERHTGKTSLINEIQSLLVRSPASTKNRSQENSQSPSSKKLQVKTSTKWKEDKGRESSNDSASSGSSLSKNKLLFKKKNEYGENGSLDFSKLNSSYFNSISVKDIKFPIDVPYTRPGQNGVIFRVNIIEKETKANEIDEKMSYEDIDLVIFTGDQAKKNSYKPYLKTAIQHFLKT